METPQNVNVNLKDTKDLICECGNRLFEEAYILKEIPALVSPSGKKSIAPIPVFVCNKCKVILKELLKTKIS